jgi:cytochrome d ubiquinol oxidase subunit II
MTWVALIFTPIVLCYQAWTYWVFRKRIGTDNLPAVAAPAPAPLPEPATAGS